MIPARLRARTAAWARRVDTFSTWAAVACLLVNIAVVLFGVVMRYGFAASPIWTDELARYSLIWAVMLAGAAAVRRGEHMQIELVVDALPPRAAWLANTLRRFAILAVLGFMTIMGAYYASKVWGMSTLAMNIPRGIPTASIAAGMGLMLVQYILLLIAGPGAPEATAGRAAV